MGDAINFGPAWLRKGVGFDGNASSSIGGPPHSSGSNNNNNSNSSSISNNQTSSNNNNNNSSSSGSAGGGGGGSMAAALAAANANSAAAAAAAAAAASTVTRYALAEFRYGREEMLALFDVKAVKQPEILVNFKNLYVEKVQCPLALTPCMDDDVVPEPDTRRVWQSRSISLGVPGRGARGGSVDRGRGRGRGLFTGYQRSTSFYDDESRGVGRGERPWLERNGTGGPLGGGSGGVGGGGAGSEVDWNNSTSSPRKEFGVRARTANMESWRRSRPDDEPSATDWRSGSGNSSGGGGGGGLSTSLSGSSLRDKWSRSTSWREEDSGEGGPPGRTGLSSERMIPGGYKPRLSALSGSGAGGEMNSGGGGGPVSALRRHWDTEDQLPEWATENPSDYGGSFDASGAFHDSDNDVDGRLDDDGGKENHVDGGRKEGSVASSRRSGTSSSKEGSASKDELPNHHLAVAENDELAVVEEKQKKQVNAASARKEELPKTVAAEQKAQNSDSSSAVNSVKEEVGKGLSAVREPAKVEPAKPTHEKLLAAENDIQKPAANAVAMNIGGNHVKPSENHVGEPSLHHHQQQHHHPHHHHHHQLSEEPKKSASNSSVDRMQEVADDMVAQLIMDDEYTGANEPDPVPVVPRSMDKSPVLGGQIPISMQQLFGGNNGGGGAGGGGVHMSRNDVGRSMLHGLGPQIPPIVGGTDIWYYRDPQGKVQGPFPASEMTEWYRAGYFDDSLSVRRACDDIYTNLGSLVALCGGAIPFLNSMNIPPIKPNSSKQQQPQPQPPQQAPASSPFQQQKPASSLQQHLQQQQQQGQPLDADITAQFEFTKKLHLLRQQGIVMQKLVSSEGWPLLSQDQKNAVIAQHMAQLQLNDSMLISPSLPTPTPPSSSNPPNPASIFGGVVPPPQDSLVNLKQVQQQQQQQPPQSQPGQQHPTLEQLQKSGGAGLGNAFQKMQLPDFGPAQPGRPMLGNLNVDPTAGGHDHLGQLIHNINFNHQPPVQNLPLGSNMLLKHNLMGSLTPQQQQQQQQQQQSQQPPKPNNLENDPIQSLLMQLSMHKQPQPQPPPQPQPAKTPVDMMAPWLPAAQQPPQQPQRPLGSGWGDLPPPTSASFGSLMQQQQPLSGGQSQQQQQPPPQQPHLGGHPLVNNEPQAPSVVSLFKHHQQVEKQNQDKMVPELSREQQQHLQQQQQHQQQQLQHQQQLQQNQQHQHHHQQQQQQQQQQQNHQQFERTQQKQQLENLSVQQQQHQHQQQLQQQQQQLQQQQQQFAQKAAKDERKEQELLLQQQQQQQQQLQQQQQQFQQSLNNIEKPAPKPANQNKLVNNVEALEEQQQQQQLLLQKQQQQQQQQQQQHHQSGKPAAQNNKGNNKKQQQSNKQQQPPHPDDDQGEFINVKKEIEEKKRQKELKKQQQEELKRKQLEEKKKLEELEAQKKAKLLEAQRREAQKIQEQQQQQQQQPRPVTKVAPWSASVAAETAATGPSLAEIQKTERERRAALARQEQAIREQQQQQEIVESLQQAQNDGSKLKWNAQTLMPQNIKSLAEIQAEEAAAAERNSREKNAAAAITAAAIAASSSKASKKDDLLGTAVWQSQSSSAVLSWNTAKLWGNNSDEQNSVSSAGGFWEEPNPSSKNGGGNAAARQKQQQQQQQAQQNQKQLLAKSKTMGSISTASSSGAVAAAKQQQKQQQQQQQQQGAAKQGSKAGAGPGGAKNAAGSSGGASAAGGANRADRFQANFNSVNEFTGWCVGALLSLNSNVDIPTFVNFLQDIESPFEVKDYIRLYLGETKECSEFAKQFLERRSKYKNLMRQKNAHIDDMCKPAPAINPSSNDFQEIKGKSKKVKKNKMTKLDNRILGFSVTAAPDRLNVGDRDYGDNA